MAKVNGKGKGNSFERKIANLLSGRFEKHLGIKNGFRRNPDSGSFFGGTNQARSTTHDLDYAIFGDLICPRSFRFSIECKHYKSPPSWQTFLNQDIRQWNDWLTQAEQDASNSHKFMALIVKYNNIEEMVFIKDDLPGIRRAFTYQNYLVYTLKDFLSLNDQYYFLNTPVSN